jgi:hypothetical protein
MTLPWLDDTYHVKALQLIDRAPKPPPAGMCEIRWCVSMADNKSGWPIDGPRRLGAQSGLHEYLCVVHRRHPDYRPHERKVNLGRVWARVDRPTRRRKAA